MASKIKLFPDPVLRQISRPVFAFDSKLQNLVGNLKKIMQSQPAGIGIAAIQIGTPLRLAIVDVSARVPKAGLMVMANPEVLETREPRSSREGCMSLPEYTANLGRFDWIYVRWQDENGDFHEKSSEGIEAICIQHEIDHMNGVLFLDHVSSLKTDMLPRSQRSTRRKS